MIKSMNRFTSKGLRLAAAGLVAVSIGACDQVLSVQNPDELPEDQLDNNPQFVPILVNGVKGDFAAAFDDPFIWRGSMLTDESLTGINWEQTARLNERIVLFDEGDADLMFSQISRALIQADSVTGRLRNLLEDASSSEEMATTLAFAGYSYILMADAMCEAVIKQGGEVFTPIQLYQTAVDRFNEGLTVAEAAGEEDLVNLINVGLTRAHLNLGNWSDVMNIAPTVPEDFRYDAQYQAPEVENVVSSRTQGNNHSLSVHPNFLANGDEYGTDYDQTPDLTDPRVQHFPEWRLGHNRLTRIYTPYAPLMWEIYNGQTVAEGGEPTDLRTIEADGSNITFASGLEARHNYMEALLASGGAEGEALDFVNERRDFGNQDPVSLSGDDLVAELRDQRGRDFFLAGYRLGDLRRWLRNGEDLFPSGPHPVTEWGDYEDATCFPIPLEEYEGNPNLSLPS